MNQFFRRRIDSIFNVRNWFHNEEDSILYFISSSTNHIDLIFNPWTLDFRSE